MLLIGAYLTALTIEETLNGLNLMVPFKNPSANWAAQLAFSFLKVLIVATVFGLLAGRLMTFPAILLGLTMGVLLAMPSMLVWRDLAAILTPSNMLILRFILKF